MAHIPSNLLLHRFRRMHQSEPSQPPAPQPSDKTDPEDDLYRPTPIDIIVAHIMLTRSLKLPPELVDSIFDMAEYWAHSTNVIDYRAQQQHELRIIGASRLENKFLLRSYPLGLTGIDGQDSTSSQEAYDTHHAKPLPHKTDCDPAYFSKLARYPTPRLVNPARKIVFKIRSHDQGWGGPTEKRGTYEASWTWFEAGLERFDSEATCHAHSSLDEASKPALPVCGLRPIQPKIAMIRSNTGHNKPSGRNQGDSAEADNAEDEYTYIHPLQGPPEWQIQCNRTATREWQEHTITWSYLDDVKSDSDEGKALENQGRGRATGDGSFVRNLRMGDVITIWDSDARWLESDKRLSRKRDRHGSLLTYYFDQDIIYVVYLFLLLLPKVELSGGSGAGIGCKIIQGLYCTVSPASAARFMLESTKRTNRLRAMIPTNATPYRLANDAAEMMKREDSTENLRDARGRAIPLHTQETRSQPPPGNSNSKPRQKRWAPKTSELTPRRPLPRARRVKCDETKPYCKQCITRGRWCEYAAPTPAKTANTKTGSAGPVKSNAKLEAQDNSAKRTSDVALTPHCLELATRLKRESESPCRTITPGPKPPNWDVVEGIRYLYQVMAPEHFSHSLAGSEYDNQYLAAPTVIIKHSFLMVVTAHRIKTACRDRGVLPAPDQLVSLDHIWARFYYHMSHSLSRVNRLIASPEPCIDVFYRIMDILHVELTLLSPTWRPHIEGCATLIHLYGGLTRVLDLSVGRPSPILAIQLMLM
ncbi:hypothetical protein E4U53_000971 [Claviceps sorghi]|nr:hypothetical protein E4U53_000971 [Claviceps sorghi]